MPAYTIHKCDGGAGIKTRNFAYAVSLEKDIFPIIPFIFSAVAATLRVVGIHPVIHTVGFQYSDSVFQLDTGKCVADLFRDFFVYFAPLLSIFTQVGQYLDEPIGRHRAYRLAVFMFHSYQAV